LPDFNETSVLSINFEKFSKHKWNENPTFVANFFLEHRRTDGHDEANIGFSKFYERTYKNVPTTFIHKYILSDGLRTELCVGERANCLSG
jgi:hypothetical protein